MRIKNCVDVIIVNVKITAAANAAAVNHNQKGTKNENYKSISKKTY